jgi:hypothetical protein
MKTRKSTLILGIGLFLCAGSPAHAQLGDVMNAAKQGAVEGAEKEVMKQAGVPTAAPAATPAATTPAAANAPAGAAAGGEPEAPQAPADE